MRTDAKIIQSFKRDGYCIFDPSDWIGLGINIERLHCHVNGSILQLASQEKGRPIWRVATAGALRPEGIEFFTHETSLALSSSLAQDICIELGKCFDLNRLLVFAGKLAGDATARFADVRFCVEVIVRCSNAPHVLLPHEDGVQLLLFAVLDSSVSGGNLRLYRETADVEPQIAYRDGRGVVFYEEESLSLLHELRCQPGAGYAINEGCAKPQSRVFHGCDKWTSFKGEKRTILRASIQGR